MGLMQPQHWDEAQKANLYTATTTVDFIILKGATQTVHWIWDVADPNASTNYDAAPIGSLYFWILAGSVTSFIKTNATTWVEQT